MRSSGPWSTRAASGGSRRRSPTLGVTVAWQRVASDPAGPATSSKPRAWALCRAGAALRRLDLPILRRSGRHQLVEQLRRRRGDRLDRPLERLLVRARRLVEAADLADVLQGGLVDLGLGRRRVEVEEGADVAAHVKEDMAPPASAQRPGLVTIR